MSGVPLAPERRSPAGGVYAAVGRVLWEAGTACSAPAVSTHASVLGWLLCSDPWASGLGLEVTGSLPQLAVSSHLRTSFICTVIKNPRSDR